MSVISVICWFIVLMEKKCYFFFKKYFVFSVKYVPLPFEDKKLSNSFKKMQNKDLLNYLPCYLGW